MFFHALSRHWPNRRPVNHLATRAAVLVLALVFTGANAFAANPDPSPEQVIQVIETARDPTLASSARRNAAQYALDYLRRHAKSSPGNLLKDFLAHPEKIAELNLNSTGPLAQVATEFSSLVRQMNSERQLGACDATKGLKAEVLSGVENYSACTENSWNHNVFNLPSAQYRKNNPKYVNVPDFAYSGNLETLIKTANLATFYPDEKLGDSKNPFVPTPEEVRRANPSVKSDEAVAGLLDAGEFIGDGYLRTIQGSVRSAASLAYRFEGLSGSAAILKDVDSVAARYCKHCTAAQKKSVSSHVKNLLKRDIESGATSKRPLASVQTNLCSQLRAMNYPFDGEPEAAQAESMARSPGGAGEAAQADMVLDALKDRRKSILAAVVAGDGDAELLLTKALVELKGQRPANVRLQCTKGSKSSDVHAITLAAKEAVDETQNFATKVNEAIKPHQASAKELGKELMTLLKLSPRAVGEGLQEDSQMNDWVCAGMTASRLKEDNDREIDEMVVWGSTLAGAALMATGAGAAPGAALIATAETAEGAVAVTAAETGSKVLLFSSLLGGATIGGAGAAYDWHRSKDALALSELYRTAGIAQSGNRALMDLSADQFEKYEQARLNAMITAGLGVTEVNLMVLQGLRNGKNVVQITEDLSDGISGARTIVSESKAAGTSFEALGLNNKDPEVVRWMSGEGLPEEEKIAQKEGWDRFQKFFDSKLKDKLTPEQTEDLFQELYKTHMTGTPGTFSKNRALADLRLRLQHPPYALSETDANSVVRDLSDRKILGLFSKDPPPVVKARDDAEGNAHFNLSDKSFSYYAHAPKGDLSRLEVYGPTGQPVPSSRWSIKSVDGKTYLEIKQPTTLQSTSRFELPPLKSTSSRQVFSDFDFGELPGDKAADYKKFRDAYHAKAFSGDAKYVSVDFGGNRLAAKIVGVAPDGRLQVELATGEMKTITREELSSLRFSETAKSHFWANDYRRAFNFSEAPGTGDVKESYESFRNAFKSGTFDDSSSYISVGFGPSRNPVRVLRWIDGDKLEVEILTFDSNAQKYVVQQRVLRESELSSARVSSTSKDSFAKYDLQKNAPPPPPGPKAAGSVNDSPNLAWQKSYRVLDEAIGSTKVDITTTNNFIEKFAASGNAEKLSQMKVRLKLLQESLAEHQKEFDLLRANPPPR
jgi:hypothetical protein